MAVRWGICGRLTWQNKPGRQRVFELLQRLAQQQRKLVGIRPHVVGHDLTFSLGLTHPVRLPAPAGPNVGSNTLVFKSPAPAGPNRLLPGAGSAPLGPGGWVSGVYYRCFAPLGRLPGRVA